MKGREVKGKEAIEEVKDKLDTCCRTGGGDGRVGGAGHGGGSTLNSRSHALHCPCHRRRSVRTGSLCCLPNSAVDLRCYVQDERMVYERTYWQR